MDAKWFFVDTQKKLQRAVNDFERAKVLSIDTEYDSFRYFREILCLIQIHANNTTYVFDPLENLNLWKFKIFNANMLVSMLFQDQLHYKL